MSHVLGPVYRKEDYAGFFRRTLALVIDVAIILFAYFVLTMGFEFLVPYEWHTDRLSAAVYSSFWPMGVVYMLGFRLLPGGTPGYRAVGIRYAYMMADRPPYYMILYRSFIAVFLLWFFFLDHIWILFDERKQAWHDKVAGFYVVKNSARPLGLRPVVRRLINFFFLSFIVYEPNDAAPITSPDQIDTSRQ